MILGQDEAVMFPTVDLYDSGMMGAYINAVRDQYQQGIRDYENFVSKYGDFMSPIAADVEYWNQHTMDPVMQTYNDLLANGIDPVRSQEGRAILAREMRNIPYAQLGELRQSAKTAEEYLRNRGQMAAKGLWNEDFERFLLNGNSIEGWNTAQNGVWNRTSPVEYQDLNTATYDWVKDLQPTDLGLDSTGKYRIIGIDDNMVRNAIAPHLGSFVNTEVGKYHLDNARKQLEAEGITNPSREDVIERLQQNMSLANQKRTKVVYDPDDYAKMDQQQRNAIELDNLRTNNDIRADRAKQELSYRYKILDAADFDLDGQISEDEAAAYGNIMLQQYNNAINRSSGSGSGANNSMPPIPAGTQLEAEQHLKYMNKMGEHVDQVNSSVKNLYNKMSGHMQQIADKYSQAVNTYSNPSSTKEEKKAAEKLINSAKKNKDKNFIAWKRQFDNASSSWTEEVTTNGRYRTRTGGITSQSEFNLAKDAKDIYNKYNRVDDITSDVRNSLNKTLRYTTGEDGKQNGIMDDTRELASITETNMTGTRTYKYNSKIKKLNKLMKGKKFFVSKDDVNYRMYGSGHIKGKQYNVITDMATFDDEDIKNELNRWSDSQIEALGIVKNADDSYTIPIATKNGHGFARANVNTNYDSNTGGKAFGVKNARLRQAEEMGRINK